MLKNRVILLGMSLLMVVFGTTGLHAGGNWDIIKNLDMDWTFSAVAFLDEWEGWVAGGSPFDQTGYIGHTRDGGKTWEQVETSIETTAHRYLFLGQKEWMGGGSTWHNCWNIEWRQTLGCPNK